MFGWFSATIGSRFSLERLQKLLINFFSVSIAGMVLSFVIKNMYLTFFFLTIVCIATGLQLSYTVLAISYVHSKIKSISRALISSLNFMIAAMLSSGFLFVFKVAVELIQIEWALVIYLLFFFLICSFCIKKRNILKQSVNFE